MDKNKIKNQCIKLISKFGENINQKIKNISAKAGQYYVPKKLYQERNLRSNRVLIPWRTVLKNNITFEQLESFEGGVVVEFLNNDFFETKYEANPLFNKLKNLLGSDDTVSSIISIHSEGGDTSSKLPLYCYEKLLNNTKVKYKNKTIKINEDNYKDYIIKQNHSVGKGNNIWSGFLFFSIKGGQHKAYESHTGKGLTLFNPACEYANENVSTDISLVLLYFMFLSVTAKDIKSNGIDKNIFDQTFTDLKMALKESVYDSKIYKGNLLDYCQNHISCNIEKNRLVDPIQLKPISINNFNIKYRKNNSLDLTHNEAVAYEKYYWDKKHNCLLSPARPSNLFWSFHLSNMMQQNFSLKEYFKNEENIYIKRQKLIKRLQ